MAAAGARKKKEAVASYDRPETLAACREGRCHCAEELAAADDSEAVS